MTSIGIIVWLVILICLLLTCGFAVAKNEQWIAALAGTCAIGVALVIVFESASDE